MNGGTYQFFIIPAEVPEARDQGSESPACHQSPKKPRKKAADFRRPTNQKWRNLLASSSVFCLVPK